MSGFKVQVQSLGLFKGMQRFFGDIQGSGLSSTKGAILGIPERHIVYDQLAFWSSASGWTAGGLEWHCLPAGFSLTSGQQGMKEWERECEC